MQREEHLIEALKAAEVMPPGSAFELKELFAPKMWYSLPLGVRTDFGKYFSQEVVSGKIPGVERLEKMRNNHWFYIKNKC